jgi:hypothetical protein
VRYRATAHSTPRFRRARTRSGLADVALPDGSLLALERALGITGELFGFPLDEY